MDIRNLLIGVLLMAVAGLAVNSCSDERVYSETVAAKEAALIKWRDHATGAEHAKRAVMATTKKQLERTNARAYQDSVIINELKRQVKKAPRRTKSLTVISRGISGRAGGYSVVSTADTTVTKYASQDSTFTATAVKTPDSLYIDYLVKDTLIFTQYAERPRLLGPLVQYVKVENKNPAVTVTGLRTYQVKPARPRTGLKIAGGFLFGAGTVLYLSRK